MRWLAVLVMALASTIVTGMTMSGNVVIAPTGTKGRYEAIGEFGMSGVWQVALEWTGSGGGSVSFQGSVQ